MAETETALEMGALSSRDDPASHAPNSSESNQHVSSSSSNVHHQIKPLSLDARVQITLVTAELLPSLRRLQKLLLSVSYPDAFYNDILRNPDGNSIARVACWRPAQPSSSESASARSFALRGSASEVPSQDVVEEPSHVVGGICCRVEPPNASATSSGPALSTAGLKNAADGRSEVSGDGNSSERPSLYVQTLSVLSPYRERGVASALLRVAVRAAAEEHGVGTVYAHVWENNVEALDWYRRRGFDTSELQPGYYRRLHPSGARVVRRSVIGLVIDGWPSASNVE